MSKKSDVITSFSDSQSHQMAINVCNNAHTGLHQAIEQLKRGSVIEAKHLISRQIAVLANALMVL